MSASITNDKITAIRDTDNPTVTTVSTARSIDGTSLACADLSHWPTDTAVHFITYQKKADGSIDRSTQVDWKGIVSSNTIGSLTLENGTDAGNSVGDFVEMAPTAAYGQDLFDALTQTLNTDGTLKSAIVDSGALVTSGLKVVSRESNPYKFSGYRNANYTLTSGNATRLPVDTANFDTNSNLDVSTNKGRYTAPLAGFYWFHATIGSSSNSSMSRFFLALYKNGVEVKRGADITSSATLYGCEVSGFIQLAANDYVEAWYFAAAANAVDTGQLTCFEGFLLCAT